MNSKGKGRIVFFLILVCLVVVLAVFYQFTVVNMENANEKKSAVVTFSPNNSTPVVITCEVASSPKQISKGLMYQEKLSEGEGMLFVFDSPRNVSYWMKNVLMPLDIIFLDESCTVINIEEAEVETNVSDDELKRYHSASPAKWVVEINQGICNSYGIEKGTEVSIEYL
ncbi:MAG: DUF192 domain-containing protein [Candidatus Thermoplasmatota archaeon]|nr:DUF192 domain-containing protein [Candidatus Thermoplasmatota archaeon]